MGDAIGTSEVDSLFDLIITIIFMLFCAFGIARMVVVMNGIVQRYAREDKIEVTSELITQNDPFYYTGYQAYMFAWMMDPYSDQPLTWLGGTDIPTHARTDGTDNEHVTIWTLDEYGEVRPYFLAYRNQMISGATVAADASVRSTLRSIAPSNVNALYKGSYSDGYGNVYLHLEFTDIYTLHEDPVYSHIGHILIERSKPYTWVLVPSYQ